MDQYINYKDIFNEFYDDEQIEINAEMKNHIYFKVGGKVDILLNPTTVEQVIKTLSVCKKNNIPYYIIGNGSNIIV